MATTCRGKTIVMNFKKEKLQEKAIRIIKFLQQYFQNRRNERVQFKDFVTLQNICMKDSLTNEEMTSFNNRQLHIIKMQDHLVPSN